MGNSLGTKNVDRTLFNNVTNVQNEEKEFIPIYFNHKIHGDNVIISEDKRIAKRIRSYCMGICFSNRPINVNEIVCIKIYETSIEWSGVLKFGFIANNPNDFCFKHKNSQDSPSTNTHSQPISPKYSCPDLDNLNEHWVKALPIPYVMKNTIFSFYYDDSGRVHYLLNGTYIGILFNIDNYKNESQKSPLWAMFDLYGNTISLELIYPYLGEINNNKFILNPKSMNGHPTPNKVNLNGFSNNFHINGTKDDNSSKSSSTVSSSISKYYHSYADSDGSNIFNILPFHTHPNAKGKNVEIIYLQTSPKSSNSEINFQRGTPTRSTTSCNSKESPVPHIANVKNFVIAARKSGEFCNAYAFTSRPVKVNEKVLIKILATESHYVGNLAFGLTVCDPATLCPPGCLPEEANFLIDRPEYWVVAKDISPGLENGDELAFYLDPQGQVIMEKNGFLIGTIMYVDTTQQLWAFWDLYGSAQKIRILGSYHITLGINELENQMNFRRLMYVSANESNTSTRQNGVGLEPAPLERYHGLVRDYLNGPTIVGNSYDRVPSTPRRGEGNNGTVISSLIPRCIYEISPHFNSGSSCSNGNPAYTLGNNNDSSGHYQTISSLPSTTLHEGMSLGQGVNLNVAPRRPLKSSKLVTSNNGAATSNVTKTPNYHAPSLLPNANSNGEITPSIITSPHSDRFHQYDTGEASCRGRSKDANPINGSQSKSPKNGTLPSSTQSSSTSSTPSKAKGPHDSAAPLTSQLLIQQECVVCYERSLDCLLYPCGHICMCHPCATATWKMTALKNGDGFSNDSSNPSTGSLATSNALGLCPICRSTIQEVVKIFLP